MPRLALLRCDAAATGGVGHLVRCLAVAEAARAAGWDVGLVGSVDVPLARALVTGAGLPVLADGAEPLEETARRTGARVLHVDHYTAVTPPLPRGGPGEAGYLLSSVQDGRWGRRDADVVLDASPTGHVTASVVDARVRLTGPRQALVRAGVRARLGTRGPTGQVLVVAGGTDAAGILPALAAVATAAVGGSADGLPYEVVVVDPAAAVGGRARHPGAVSRPPGPDLLDQAARSALVVTAAGTTTSELAVMGVPMAVVQAVDNQAETYRDLVASGAALPLGTAAGLLRDRDRLAADLREVLADAGRLAGLAAAAAARVDGAGAARLVAAWDAVWTGRTADGDRGWWVARAAPGDSDLLLAWRNDAQTRAQSITTDPVSPSAHAAWFSGVLADPGRHLLLVGSGAQRVGTVRFDRLGAGAWEVSLTLAPESRGRGLSGTVLSCGEEHLLAHGGGGDRLVARVREGNAASLALFGRAGYRPADARTSAALGGDHPGLRVVVKALA
ncbi:GNAT family N-acetyltransferase [Geodermatophilus maliterrae]|uniref:GNAT family N-acetyltransferase n=1 Tax=Geodermatophilus maliterrae TaxID=3162531 RepID=A0ABV3XCD3_9ACTN